MKLRVRVCDEDEKRIYCRIDLFKLPNEAEPFTDRCRIDTVYGNGSHGFEAETGVYAIIRNSLTLVPVRFVSESLKMKVFFEEGELFVTDAIQQ